MTTNDRVYAAATVMAEEIIDMLDHMRQVVEDLEEDVSPLVQFSSCGVFFVLELAHHKDHCIYVCGEDYLPHQQKIQKGILDLNAKLIREGFEEGIRFWHEHKEP